MGLHVQPSCAKEGYTFRRSMRFVSLARALRSSSSTCIVEKQGLGPPEETLSHLIPEIESHHHDFLPNI